MEPFNLEQHIFTPLITNYGLKYQFAGERPKRVIKINLMAFGENCNLNLRLVAKTDSSVWYQIF